MPSPVQNRNTDSDDMIMEIRQTKPSELSTLYNTTTIPEKLYRASRHQH